MRSIGILIFDDVELLDFAGPYEVFSVANELNDFGLFKIFTVSETGDVIKSVHGLRVLPDYSIDDCPECDILVIPGGEGTKRLIRNTRILDWVKAVYESSEITFSVCSGARIPGKLGLLDDKEFTTHHEVIADMLAIAPGAKMCEGKRFVDNGKIMTSAGISAGIDLSLHIVEKLHGSAVREKTVAYMQYDCGR